jgi:hypothetical protein
MTPLPPCVGRYGYPAPGFSCLECQVAEDCKKLIARSRLEIHVKRFEGLLREAKPCPP